MTSSTILEEDHEMGKGIAFQKLDIYGAPRLCLISPRCEARWIVRDVYQPWVAKSRLLESGRPLRHFQIIDTYNM
nr:hypothetical protein CFP56_31503 [Quercus suber]